MNEISQIVVVGCGAIGLPVAVAFASRVEVLGVDTDSARLTALRAGVIADIDEGLGEALTVAIASGRLTFAAALAPSDNQRAFIIAVPTPLDGASKPVLANVEAAFTTILGVARDGDLVAIRATVPIGMTRRLAQAARGRLRVAACPDRSIAGRSYAEQFTVPHIVGGIDGAATRAAADLFAMLGPTVEMSSPEAAEAAKLFANVQRDVTFALANQFALVSEQLGLDLGEIVRAAGEGYPRFALARPGPVAGPCLTKDTAVLASSSGLPEAFDVAGAARRLNESLLDHVAKAVSRHVRGIARAKVTVLGLAFKGSPATADRRGSFGVALAERLRADLAHATIASWEPASDNAGDLDRAIATADVVVIANDHVAIRTLDVHVLAARMNPGSLIYDTCGALTAPSDPPNGVTLRRLGDGRPSGAGHILAAISAKRAR